MEISINETPVRTSRNFNINNINLKDIDVPKKIGNFQNVDINCNSSKIKVEESVGKYNLKYGISNKILEQVKNYANKKYKIVINSLNQKEIFFDFKFDSKNKNLVQDIEIVANKDSKATVVLKFYTEEDIKLYNNLVLRTVLNEGSNINVILINFMNLNTINFMSIDSVVKENAKLNYTIIDFGGKYSITNYYSNLLGNLAQNLINTIYLGSLDQIFDLNYITHLNGEKSNVNIEVQGALKNSSKKHFKGTIDFKKGAKKSTGNENESCILLSKEAGSISLPMLLCSEEDVEGNHSSSAGKIDERELFYLMSRGFSKSEAMKLMVKAKFNKIIESIKNDKIKEEILRKIDKKLED